MEESARREATGENKLCFVVLTKTDASFWAGIRKLGGTGVSSFVRRAEKLVGGDGAIAGNVEIGN